MDEITAEEYQALIGPRRSQQAQDARKGSGRRGRAPAPQKPAQALTEHQEQVTLVSWADALAGRLPALRLLLAIPNGERRDIVTGARLKAQGVRRGVPDLFLAHPAGDWAGLWLELKRADGGRTSPEQKAWHKALHDQGYDVRVCRGWEEAACALLIYLGRRPEEFGLGAAHGPGEGL